MKLTDTMLQAAACKAVELGILPPCSRIEGLAANAALMREVLQAALDAAQEEDQAQRAEPGLQMETVVGAIPPASGAAAVSAISGANRR